MCPEELGPSLKKVDVGLKPSAAARHKVLRSRAINYNCCFGRPPVQVGWWVDVGENGEGGGGAKKNRGGPEKGGGEARAITVGKKNI